MEPVTVNFAMTREDNMDFQLARTEAGTAKSEFISMKACGVCLILLAFLVFLVRPRESWLSAVAMASGIFLLFLCKPLLRAIIRRRAADAFEAGLCGMPAQTVSFLESCVRFRSERYEGKIPYDMMLHAYENGTVFLLFTGAGECRCVPRRTMDDAERKRVEDLLKDHMKQKFTQEGARVWTK